MNWTAAVAGLALVACAACGRDSKTPVDAAQQQGDRTAAPDLRSTRETNSETHRAVTLEGCLQRGAGTFTRGYVLTMVNEPSSVGTAGSVTSSGSSVEREQMRMAASTYRIDPSGDVKLTDLVGKRIRVSGTVAEEARAPNGAGPIGSDRDVQVPNRDTNAQRERDPHLDPRDLAKVDVTSASVIAEACGR